MHGMGTAGGMYRPYDGLLRRCRRAVAAVEFAMVFPILLAFLGGATDFGIVYYRQSCLSAAVAAGAQYALVTDVKGGTLTAANIQTVMQNAAAQTMPSATVTPTATDPTLCYCINTSTTPATMSSAVTCGSTCSSGGTAGKFTHLTLSHQYTPIMPLFSMVGSPTTLTKQTWVPLQ